MTSAVASASAAQREVVRRLIALDERGASARPDLERLLDLVLVTPVGGRGRVDPGGDGRDLPARELLRVAASVLVRISQEQGVERANAPARPESLLTSLRGRRASRRPKGLPAYRLAGTGALVPQVRRRLAAAGAPEGGEGARLLVLAAPMDDAFADHWRWRVHHGAGLRWRRLWARASAREHVPVAADPLAVADRLGSASRTDLVVADDLDTAVGLVSSLLGVDAGDGPMPPPGIDVTGVDLVRWINHLSASAVEPLPLTSQPPQPLGCPEDRLGWATEWATRLAERLEGSSRPVHGVPTAVVPSQSGALQRVASRSATLERALGELLAARLPRK